ncbi:MAG: DUF6089 family protein [Ferruginibacter sp.]
MNIFKFCGVLSVLAISITVNAQKKERAGVRNPVNVGDGEFTKFSITAGAGIASYLGDLKSGNNIYSQASYSFSAGATYAFTNKIHAKFDIGIERLQAADSKNKEAQFKARNLSFKSSVFDMSVSAEYNILNLNNYKLTPYVSAGVGVMLFYTYANDATGRKQYLRELGTEGQGLAGYPEMYSRTAVIFPLGLGVKYPINEKLTLSLDFNYRVTGTDYIDDVSKAGYPDKALLDARNPITAQFTWRGNEVGGGVYPKNLNLPRGNPKNKDGYFTNQVKIAFKL